MLILVVSWLVSSLCVFSSLTGISLLFIYFLAYNRSVTYELVMACFSSSKYSVVSYISLISRLHISWIRLVYFPFPFLFYRTLTVIPRKGPVKLLYQQNNFSYLHPIYLCQSTIFQYVFSVCFNVIFEKINCVACKFRDLQ